jgi:hypothetical protein
MFLFIHTPIIFQFAIVATEATRANEQKRLGYMFALAFLVGCTTGPLIEYVGAIDPSIVFNAYVITLIVFGCFTMAALHAESTKYLHLGGIPCKAIAPVFKYSIEKHDEDRNFPSIFRNLVLGHALPADHLVLRPI